MARTTLTSDEDLLRRLRRRAAEEGCALTELVDRLLRLALETPPRKGYRFRPKVVRGRTQPGVDLDDRGALFDRMDGR